MHRMRNSLLCALAAPVAAQKLHCGVGTNTFADCPQCLESAMNSGVFDFWWNWDYAVKVDMSHLNPEVVGKARKTFTPMIWGTKLPKDSGFFSLGGEYVMGFNEPDQYGPACAGDLMPRGFGCGENDFRPATSAGFASLFDPAKAAKEWQKLVNFLASVPERASSALRKIAAPAMAQSPLPLDDCSQDPALPNTTKYCRGWLQHFKEQTLLLECMGLSGQKTNCWDVVDALPIHAYARTAQEVKDKIHQYHKVFQEDFDGINGRTRKTLWLTEVTMGTNDATDLVKFVDDLMNSENGLQNRQLFGFLDRVSWFSQWSVGSFQLGSYAPHTDEAWSSSLFEPTTGRFTPHGLNFVRHCRQNSTSPSAGAPAPVAPSMAPAPVAPSTAPREHSRPKKESMAPCAVGAAVPCPGTGSCAGNQCCPDGSTCPSADAGFKDCTDSKTEDCTQVTEEIHLLMLSVLGHSGLSAGVDL
ncbi:unnamed protein product [Effrenium voratum]|uniref:Asl1-like glycosyl hydrolase catalytic domain-containing protein n=1 Tax=Effrenium voratum TaxID=2562239 RepID=A0AA36JAW5_9DINO|nr:unnamed protein product [Effrenium voratum]